MSQAGSFTKPNTGVTSLTATAPITVSGATGAVNISLTTPLAGQYGGTGVANTGLTINLAGGSTGLVLTSDGSGNATWAASAGAVLSVSGTANVITATPTTGNVVVNISPLYVGQPSITTLGTISTGIWAGTTIAVNHGGTGLSSTTVNQILYSSSTNVIAGLATANNGVLITSNSGIPSLLANGTAGFVLTANSGAPPSWQAGGSGTVTGPGSSTNRAISTWNGTTGTALFDNSGATISSLGDLTVLSAHSGTSSFIQVVNTSNTSSSTASLVATVGGASALSAITLYQVSAGATWATGLLVSDSSYRISSTAVGNSDSLIITSGGSVTATLGDLAVSRSQVGAAVQLACQNTDTTNTSSAARIIVGSSSSGAGGGDAYILYNYGNSITPWKAGVNHSNGDWQIYSQVNTGVSNLDGTLVMDATSAGVIRFPGTTQVGTTQPGTGIFAVTAAGDTPVEITSTGSGDPLIGLTANGANGYTLKTSRSTGNFTIELPRGTPLFTIPSGGGIATVPPSSHTATVAFGSLTSGTPKQNTLGYDILLNISVTITVAAVAGTIVLGVGSTSTPTTDAVTGTISVATVVSFSAIIPANYYVSVTTTGTLTVGSVTVQACPL
jgi:hypothetical protein